MLDEKQHSAEFAYQLKKAICTSDQDGATNKRQPNFQKLLEDDKEGKKTARAVTVSN